MPLPIRLPLIFLPLLIFSSGLLASSPSKYAIIDQARSLVGTEEALDGLITLEILGKLEKVDRRLPSATLLIFARKPCSQRMEIRVDDMVETTIMNHNSGCIIRSNLAEDASQMRALVGSELERVAYNTHQFFTFYRPHYKEGETVQLEGVVEWRDQSCYKLVYTYLSGLRTIRYFSKADFSLVATITANGVESVGRGAQEIDGIEFPESIDYYEDGRKLHTVVLESIKVNKPLPAGIFDTPKRRQAKDG